MAIQLHWDETVPHTVHYRFGKGWTWEDFRLAALEEHRQGEALNGIHYDVIGDLRQATIPRGTAFSNVIRLFDKGPRNRRAIIVVGSSLARSMIQIGGTIYPQVRNRFFAADTIDEARHLILRLRAEADAARPPAPN
jgi:hypothetical protein